MDAEPSPKIEYLGDLQRLELKPGDRFVLTVPGPIGPEAIANIKKSWEQFVGKSPLIVLEHGMKVGVINDGAYSDEPPQRDAHH